MSYDRLNWYIFLLYFSNTIQKIKGNVILTGIIRRTYLNYRQRIRDLREDADKTQTQIADYLGTSQTMQVLSSLVRLYTWLHQCKNIAAIRFLTQKITNP